MQLLSEDILEKTDQAQGQRMDVTSVEAVDQQRSHVPADRVTLFSMAG